MTQEKNDQQQIFKTLRSLENVCNDIEPNNPMVLRICEVYNELKNYVYNNHYGEWVRKEKIRKDQDPSFPLYHHAE